MDGRPMVGTERPPASEPANVVSLESIKDGKILNISLYSGRAEVTRFFKFSVSTGQNTVHIRGLPSAIDQQSLRVKGKGLATIHDVTLGHIPTPDIIASKATSDDLVELLKSESRTKKSIQRCEKSISSLESFLSSIKVEHVTDLEAVMNNYESVGQKLDDKMSELQHQLEEIELKIQKERLKLAGPPLNRKLNMQASVGVFAEREGSVEIVLIYAVRNANWNATYDIRVDMDATEKPVTLVYKAAVEQNTGESWDDVPLTLETASPTFGVGLPVLQPWTVSVAKPRPPLALPPPPRQPMPVVPLMRRAPSMRFESEDLYAEESVLSMDYQTMAVTSKGNINASFRIPGLVSIPSDGLVHTFTIIQLSLDAVLTWVAVPKQDARTHLNSKIKNASEFTLLAGPSSIYLDGSFIAQSTVPLVSPQESSECSLGLDPSIRIVYHPISKKLSQSGFYSKSSTYVFVQRLTLHNTKTTPAARLKLVDQIPISEDAQCVVKLVSPAITTSQTSPATTLKSKFAADSAWCLRSVGWRR